MSAFAAPPRNATTSLKEQLEAEYKLARVAYTSGQATITEPGAVLIIQRAGILGVPPGNLTLAPPATFKNGSLIPPSKVATTMAGKKAHLLPVGEKVYVTKIEVSPHKDKVTFHIMECDTCNGTAQRSSYKADVIFEFPKGSLATASVADVENMIAQVFTIDMGGGVAQPAQPTAQPEQPAQPAAQPEQPPQPTTQPAQPAAAQPSPAQTAPTQIQLGQTIDQVVAALGQPEKIVDLGAKKIYVYKDLKITFVDGKVSDVQ
jgi:hypothetical protein